MSWTVNTLAKLSGISVRTLRYYDEIGLLKPAYIGDNKYRYYEEGQLLLLQQILFFKELGFELKQIQYIIGQTDFNTLEALRTHTEEVQRRMKKLKIISKTLHKTIDYLEGKKKMSEKELYKGLSEEEQKEYEKYLLNKYGIITTKLMVESYKNIKNWKKEDWDRYHDETTTIYRKLVDAIESDLLVDSDQVQMLVKQHYELVKQYYHPTKEVYCGLGRLYIVNPDFRKMYDSYHPELAEFLAEAMQVYAEKNIIT